MIPVAAHHAGDVLAIVIAETQQQARSAVDLVAT